MKNTIANLSEKASFVGGLGAELITDKLTGDALESEETTKESIVIVGGELFNKGAQAMTFTVVDQLSRRFPEKDIYLFSDRDFERDPTEKEQYAFTIVPWGVSQRIDSMPLSLTYDVPNSVHEDVRSILNDCFFMIDINGYALTSQWGVKKSLLYMSNIAIAKKYSIPLYILPQSIGPFDYPTPQQFLLEPFLSNYLPYPKIICPREDDGVRQLLPYTTDNISRQFDIVLQYDEYNLENIYTERPSIKEIEIESDAVGIVPNARVAERKTDGELDEIYSTTIETLLAAGFEVYILRHSTEDLAICKEIQQLFDDTEAVHLVDDDLSALELERIIDQFEFLIGSRYHSLVHAYKNNTPVIAIGWAIKYKELLAEFGQAQYYFDGRETLSTQELETAISQMIKNRKDEAATVERKRAEILRNDLITDLFEK
ncbi:polysaccharide pyruvyl transferase family protein [Natronococcus occultus]|uniref:Polysaccharide pyruvyl transferase domain-containing protein n=1 Tax=Natronococcus occultus SP4 TaxID=694430 RepID=L0K3T0_9EURY|nr:polysaccharide pyruvyl transferase family protein [Natronococcus occultus]AGB38758.1 hypothetical protein Natoc_3004 [Natronococcus occultus SP4]